MEVNKNGSNVHEEITSILMMVLVAFLKRVGQVTFVFITFFALFAPETMKIINVYPVSNLEFWAITSCVCVLMNIAAYLIEFIKRKRINIDSIIFDLDGTLWNSIEGVCNVWNSLLTKYPNIDKVVTTTDIERCMGLKIDEIGKKLFPELDKDFQMKLMKECCDTEIDYLGEHGGILFPKLEETLSNLSKKYKLFIVSNCQDGYIQCFFKAHKLEKYFTDYECIGVTGLSKGENIRSIIKRNTLKSAIYVGDTNGDAEASKVANIPFIYARYGFGDVKEYDYVIDSFEEILTLEIY